MCVRACFKPRIFPVELATRRIGNRARLMPNVVDVMRSHALSSRRAVNIQSYTELRAYIEVNDNVDINVHGLKPLRRVIVGGINQLQVSLVRG